MVWRNLWTSQVFNRPEMGWEKDGKPDRGLSSRTTNGPDTQLIVREVELKCQRHRTFQTKIYFSPGKNLCTSREGRLGAADR